MNYSAKPENPYHLSIGAIPIDKEGNIYLHHYKVILGHDDIYMLMTETLKPGESVEDALHRGLLEELGIKGEIKKYLGTRIKNDTWFGEIGQPTLVEKAVIFFLVEVTEFNPENRAMREKSRSEVATKTKEDLISTMLEQKDRTGINYTDYSEMLERF